METLRDRSTATQKTLSARALAVVSAGQKLGEALSTEADAWRVWARDRARRSATEIRALLAPRTFERAVLVRADHALAAVDQRVKSRIAALDAPPSKRPAKKRAPVKTSTRQRSVTNAQRARA